MRSRARAGRYLENRLRITAELRRDRGLADERIERPIVVCGAPRAGTSILHQLLAQDPAARAPLAWEPWCPAPCPDPATWRRDPRIPLANRDVRLSASLAPSFDGIHGHELVLRVLQRRFHDGRRWVVKSPVTWASYRRCSSGTPTRASWCAIAIRSRC
ncbi:MAG TPA: sulfotransferase [Acidimicrobiales bacterium]